MYALIISVLLISAAAAVLAALLVIAEHFFADYGLCMLMINDKEEETVEGGSSLLSILNSRDIFIPSACGGKGTCGLCKVRVLEGGGPLLPTEEPYLDITEQEENIRLSCQVKVREDIRIEIPEDLLSVQEYRAVCTLIEDLTHDVKRFSFRLEEPSVIDFVPGQYIQLLAPEYEKSTEAVYRAYSIASDPSDSSSADLIIRLVPGGICTTYCFEYLKEGDEVTMTGPFGEFRLSDTENDMIWIAGGSGMAPFVSILHHMRNIKSRRKAVYYFGANRIEDLFLTQEMKEFEQELAGFSFVPVVFDPESEWDGETGLVTEAAGRNHADLSGTEGYLCGSPGMIDASVSVLTDTGMNSDMIYYDKFA